MTKETLAAPISEFIFQNAPFASAHASTLEETPRGLIAAWFGGNAEGQPDVGIWVSRHENGIWTAPIEVANGIVGDGRYPCWNPVLFQAKNGPLLLFYKVGPFCDSWWGMLMSSDDNGQNWNTPRRLPDGILGPIKNQPIQLQNGDILCPSSTESKAGNWQVHFERTSDFGKTWQSTPPLNDGYKIGAIQPSILVHPDHRLQAIGRTQQDQIFTVESKDNGKSWGALSLLDVPNPNSGTDALTLRDGRHLLVYNHTPRARTPLNVALSEDGIHWQAVLTLENGDGEFSYPAIIQTRDGTIHITYTWQRKLIKHVAFDLKNLCVDNANPQLFVLEPARYKYLVDEFNAAVPEDVANAIPNARAWDWMTRNVPFFDCPDEAFLRTYYYRWWVFRRHLKATSHGWTMSEFILPVSWATDENAISATTGHDIMDARWLRDAKYGDDWLRFWYQGHAGKMRPALLSYSGWLSFAAYQRFLVDGGKEFLVSLLPGFIEEYEAWQKTHGTNSGLLWQYDVRDGMEESITGSRTEKNLRPTINSYQYGAARAIAATARLAANEKIAARFDEEAARLKNLVQTQLWDKDAQFFKVLQTDGKLSEARELLGFVPWYFHLPDNGYQTAWQQFKDDQGFRAPWGLTSAEQRHPRFAVSYEGHDCKWDGPIWPFATSQTLTAAANLLNDYTQQVLAPTDYFDALQTYARSHQLTLENGRTISWIDENQDPFTGTWIAREIKRSNNDPDPNRGAQYKHSTFADLIIGGLVGLRPHASDSIEINPLLPEGKWDWFCLDAVPYHGRTLTIVWDKDGQKYGKGAGLRVFAEGKLIASRAKLGCLRGELKAN